MFLTYRHLRVGLSVEDVQYRIPAFLSRQSCKQDGSDIRMIVPALDQHGSNGV